MKTNTLILALGLISTLVHAENFELQNIRTGGTGCPSEVTQIVTAPDLSSASIIFQGFESHVPMIVDSPKINPNISILNCNIFLDIKLPEGQKLDSIEISYDMRGNAFLDRGVSGSFKSFLISSMGLGTERAQGARLLQEKNWLNTNSEQEEDFTVQTTKTLPILSQCRGSVRGPAVNDRVSLHLQHQLGSQILGPYQRTNASGTIVMDSSDLTGGVKIRAITSSCGRPPIPPRPPREPREPREPRDPREQRECRVERINGRAVTICP
jgi:hypothetical protein